MRSWRAGLAGQRPCGSARVDALSPAPLCAPTSAKKSGTFLQQSSSTAPADTPAWRIAFSTRSRDTHPSAVSDRRDGSVAPLLGGAKSEGSR